MNEAPQTNVDTDDSIESEVRLFYQKTYTPTEKDLKMVNTREEQIELCLRHKCRVNIWRWNPVHDYKMEFTKSGRYQRWNDKLRLRMLAHAMNKIKPKYDENEIAKIRKNEWEMEKKNSILSLNLWKCEREQRVHKKIAVCDSGDPSAQEINSTVYNPRINANTTGPELNLSCSDHIYNGDVFNYVNTESMTIVTQSQMTEQFVQPSQDVLSSDYDNFNNEIPLTSTQSQHPKSQELVDFLL